MNHVTFKNGIPYLEYKEVKNVDFFMKRFYDADKNFEPKEWPVSYSICGYGFVPDGDYHFVFTIEQSQHIHHGKCSCGISNEVHGACCGWSNAKTVIDENLIIRDDRHPFYNKNYNDFINSIEFRERLV